MNIITAGHTRMRALYIMLVFVLIFFFANSAKINTEESERKHTHTNTQQMNRQQFKCMAFDLLASNSQRICSILQ